LGYGEEEALAGLYAWLLLEIQTMGYQRINPEFHGKFAVITTWLPTKYTGGWSETKSTNRWKLHLYHRETLTLFMLGRTCRISSGIVSILVALVESLPEQYQSLLPVCDWLRFCDYFCFSIFPKIEEILLLSCVIMLCGFVQHHVHPCSSLLELLCHKHHNSEPDSWFFNSLFDNTFHPLYEQNKKNY
jgi:hypothetical protein